MNYKTKIATILAKDYDHETPDKPRSVEFNKAIKAMLKSMFPGAEIAPTKGAWCEASGFIVKEGKYVFYSFQDYRYGNWFERILIRTAEGPKDYRGGANHFTDLDNMAEDVNRLLERGF